jgi:hypothetical protein
MQPGPVPALLPGTDCPVRQSRVLAPVPPVDRRCIVWLFEFDETSRGPRSPAAASTPAGPWLPSRWMPWQES